MTLLSLKEVEEAERSLEPLQSVTEQAVKVTRGKSPEQAARNITAANKLGVPLRAVEADEKYYNDWAYEPDYNWLNQNAPLTAKYLSNVENASVSKDDHEVLSNAETISHKFLRGGKALARLIPRGAYTIEEGLGNAIALFMSPFSSAAKGIEQLTGLKRGGLFDVIEQYGLSHAKTQRAILEGEIKPLGFDLGVSPEIKGKRLIENWNLLIDPEWMITQGGDAAANLIPMLAGAYLSGGSTLVAGAMGGIQEAGAFYNQLRTEGKTTQEEAYFASVTYGVVSSYLNKIGFESIVKKIPVSSFLDRVFKSAVHGGIEAGTEWSEELAQAAIQVLAEEGITDPAIVNKLAVGVGEAAKNVDVMVGAMMMGGGTSYVNLGNEYRAVQEFKQMTEELGDALDESKTKKRSPEKVEEFLSALIMDGEAFLADGEKINPDILKKLGVDVQDIVDGQDARVDIKKVILLSKEDREQVLDYIKPSPNHYSLGEMNDLDIDAYIHDSIDKKELSHEMAQTITDYGMAMMSKKAMDKIGIPEKDQKYMAKRLESAIKQADKKYQKAKLKYQVKNAPKWEQQAEKQYKAKPEYKVLHSLRVGKGLNREALLEIYGKDVVDSIPTTVPKVARTGGETLEIAAVKHGYDTVDDMVQALASMPTKQKYIDDFKAAKMATQSSVSPAKFLVGSSAYADYLYTIAKYEKKNSTKKIPTPKVFKNRARETFKGYTISKALRTDWFMGAVKKHAILGTQRASEKVRLNHEIARLSLKQRDKVTDVIKRANRIINSSIDQNYKDQALGVIKKFGLSARKISSKPVYLGEFFQNLREGVDDISPQAVPSYSDFMYAAEGKSYKELTVAEFAEVEHLLKYLEKRGRIAKEDLLTDGKTKLGDVVNTLSEPIINRKQQKRNLDKTKILDRLSAKTREFFATHESLLFAMRKADGFIDKGVNTKTISNRLTDAETKNIKLTQEYNDKFKPLFEHLAKKARKFPKIIQTDVPVPGIMTEYEITGWTYNKVLAVALNMGTEMNRQRIRDGYGLSDADMKSLTSIFTDEDWDVIQKVWDTLNELWPMLQKAGEKVNGFKQQPVKPSLFRTSTGKVLKGGYYPLKYDHTLSDKVGKWNEKDDLMNSIEAMFPATNPKNSMLQQRVKKASLPVKLDMGVLTEHLNDTIRYITHAEAIYDINQIFKHETYRRAFKHAEGIPAYRELLKALANTARPNQEILSTVDSWLLEQSQKSTAYMLGLNLSVALKQPFSLPGLINDLGGAGKGSYYMMRAGMKILKNPWTAYTAFKEASPYMKARGERIDRDFKRDINQIKWGSRNLPGITRDAINKFIYSFIKAMDFAAVFPGWHAAQIKGMQETNGDFDASVKIADNMIRASQPSTFEVDQNYYQRNKKGWQRMFSMFSTFTFIAGKRQRYHWNQWRNGTISTSKYLSKVAIEQIAPPVLMNLMFAAIWGEDPEEKDIIADVIAYQFIGFFMIREIAATARYYYKGSRRKGVVSPATEGLNLASDLLNKSISLAENFNDDEALTDTALAAVELFSYHYKLPIPKITRKVLQGIEQFENGEGTELNMFIRNPNK